MKNANEPCLNCTEFLEHISDYIDDDMAEAERIEFLRHAEVCVECDKTLNGCRHVRNLLGRLSPVSVSSEFDVRLKSRIRMEHNFLEDPVYRFKLFMSDNLPRLLAVPAAAALVVSAMLYFNGRNPGIAVDPAELVSNPRVSYPIEHAAEQSQEEIVSYILESVSESDMETGIFLNDLNQGANDAAPVPSGNEITPVNDITF